MNGKNCSNLIITLAVILFAAFTSCKKIDYHKLEGTTWEAETDNVVFVLRFVDESTCTIITARNDNTFSANLTTYRWRYASNVDSMWGFFHLYHIGEEGEYAFPGTIENKKLYLGIHGDGYEGLWFTRKNDK